MSAQASAKDENQRQPWRRYQDIEQVAGGTAPADEARYEQHIALPAEAAKNHTSYNPVPATS